MVERTNKTPNSVQGLTEGDLTPRSNVSEDSFGYPNLAQEAYNQYSSADLEHKVQITNTIYAMKHSGDPDETASAKEFNGHFKAENAYLRENALKLTQSYDPKDPSLTPFIKTILDEHPFMARRMFDLVVKEEGETAVPKLAHQLFNRWNNTTSGMQESDRNALTKIIDGCIPELSKPFRDLFYVKPKRA